MDVQAAVNEVPQSEAASVRKLAALVEQMRIGQERALEELYDATVGKLYALASAILRSAEDTEEVVCETYAYAWANASRQPVGLAADALSQPRPRPAAATSRDGQRTRYRCSE
jgi:hypothetical protein